MLGSCNAWVGATIDVCGKDAAVLWGPEKEPLCQEHFEAKLVEVKRSLEVAALWLFDEAHDDA